MNVEIPDRKLKRAIENDAERTKRFGAERAKKIRQRMGELKAAGSLLVFWPPYSGPERCHELKGDLAGIFSMDLKHPYRLLFRSLENLKDEEGLDQKQRWQSIKSIEIVGIEDTH